MHTLAAGKYDQRRKALLDQPIKIVCTPVRECTPVDFGIIDAGAPASQLVA